MRISRARLLAEASATGFRPEALEKAILLLGLLESFQTHPFLKNRLALKGGTALNLFLLDLPRLSVDADLNFVGSVERKQFLGERPKIDQAIGAVLKREGFTARRVPREHAGGKWRLSFPAALGKQGEGVSRPATGSRRGRTLLAHQGGGPGGSASPPPRSPVEGSQRAEIQGKVTGGMEHRPSPISPIRESS